MNLTIYQKMLVAPAIAMTVYCAYLYVMYSEYRQATLTIEAIRDSSLPVIELAGENIRLFDGLVTLMKDAVLAGENDWLNNTKEQKGEIDTNLLLLTRYMGVVPPNQVRQLKVSFQNYYNNAYTLSLMLLGHKGDTDARNRLIGAVEHDHSVVRAGMAEIRATVNQRVNDAVRTTTQRLNSVLVIGVSVGIVLAVLVVALTFVVSLTTRKSLAELNGRMRDLAQGNPDFSQRLVQHSKDELGELIAWFNMLSDKLEQDYKKIELLSITDKLTQLYNRTKIEQLFCEVLKRAERYDEVFSVILLDLDHFKAVNDEFGHMIGDSVLKELSQILISTVRETDYVGRWGGEEFIIITPKTDAYSAVQLAEKVRERIEKYSFTKVGHKTASFGVASFAQGDNEDSMTSRADEYLYHAKQGGRNGVVGEAARPELSWY